MLDCSSKRDARTVVRFGRLIGMRPGMAGGGVGLEMVLCLSPVCAHEPLPGHPRHMFGLARTTLAIGVRWVVRLALRPEFSAQARDPTDDAQAPRGVGLGLLVLTAGPVQSFHRRYPTAPVTSPLPA